MLAIVTPEIDMSDDDLDIVREWRAAVGQNLAIERKSEQLSQAEMSLKLGVARRTVSDIERGLSTNFDNYIRYAIELDVDFALIVAKARLIVRAKTLDIDVLE